MIERAAGILPAGRRPRYGLHAFRHAAASLFIEEGWSPKRVQSVMGHSTIGVTFDTYGHLMPNGIDDAAALANDYLARQTGERALKAVS